MPIGTIYGFFIGTLIIGLILGLANSNFKQMKDRTAHLMSQIFWIIGYMMIVISITTLIGTFIEVGFGQ
jgi:p-aminobenzoyl-glutamate transporter AbgT